MSVLSSLLLATSATAVTVTGPSVTADASGPGRVSFTLDLSSGMARTVTVDPMGESSLQLDVVIDNSTGEFLQGLLVSSMSGASLSSVGDATDGGSVFFPTTALAATAASVDFSSNLAATVAGIEIGDPSSGTGAINWTLDAPANNFMLSFRPTLTPVPEPGTALLLGSGLFALGLRRRAR